MLLFFLLLYNQPSIFFFDDFSLFLFVNYFTYVSLLHIETVAIVETVVTVILNGQWKGDNGWNRGIIMTDSKEATASWSISWYRRHFGVSRQSLIRNSFNPSNFDSVGFTKFTKNIAYFSYEIPKRILLWNLREQNDK